ncbi:MAG: 16S rRNA (adenine(1518)-N(6)/adenine(1519)-N(6))-dimethyltransferase RsmA [Alphaproteobacteria bacterium]
MSESYNFSNALDQLPPLREVINQYALRAEKSLGQNFLLDGNITDKIAGFAAPFLTHSTQTQSQLSSPTLIEIGPGPGGLTRSLLKMAARSHDGNSDEPSPAAKVLAVEFDPRAIEALQDLVQVANGRLTLVQGDALDVDVIKLTAAPRVIVANLPYNIATPLLLGWLEALAADASAIDGMVLMFQKEVAERICALPATKAYGRLAVMTQWLCTAQRVYDLPPSAFTPPPKVTSSVVRFVPRFSAKTSADNIAATPQPSFKVMEKIVAEAFNQRRKMLRSSLKAYLPEIEACGINPELRAENLSIADFVTLALAVEARV